MKAKRNNLDNMMVVLCTDNSTVEKVFYKINSSSPKIFDCVARMQLLETEHKCNIYIYIMCQINV